MMKRSSDADHRDGASGPWLSRREFAARGLAIAAGAALLPRLGRIPYGGKRVQDPPAWVPATLLLDQIPRLLDLADVPGLALAAGTGGAPWIGTFGLARRETRDAMMPTTLFEGASLGKPVFAYAVLRLVDAGLLELDRPLSEYAVIPDARGPLARRITTRQVLSHTTGIAFNWRLQPGPLEPAVEPGRRFDYSGEGFVYLSRVIERLTGRPIARVVEEQVFQPLGMTSTSYAWEKSDLERMAGGYDAEGKRLDVYRPMGQRYQAVADQWKKPIADWTWDDCERAMPIAFPDLPVLPIYMMPNVAGSLFTTVQDYARFAAHVMGSPGAQPALLRPTTRNEMLRPQVRLNAALWWGLGWGLEDTPEGRLCWHWGANGTFRNFVVGDPASGRIVVTLTNSANGPKVYERVIASLTGFDHPAFLWFEV